MLVNCFYDVIVVSELQARFFKPKVLCFSEEIWLTRIKRLRQKCLNQPEPKSFFGALFLRV